MLHNPAKAFPKSKGAYPALYIFAAAIQSAESLADVAAAIETAAANPALAGRAYQAMLGKLRGLALSGDAIPYPIFKKGNGKLPFWAFSSLPAVTCAGAGDCLDFCYSFRAWRFAAAFGRMAQNAILMRFNPAAIESAFSALPVAAGFDFRLYVDGDFATVADVRFWMELLGAFPAVRAYGYSKSFGELLAYAGPWPRNYQLNVSSGHRHDAATVAAVSALPITRGEFVAVSIGRKVAGADHAKRETQAAVRAAMGGRRVFVCGGTCGNCTSSGHACGSAKFAGIPIAIAMH